MDENSIKFKKNLLVLCDLLGEIIDYVKNKNFKTDLSSTTLEILKFSVSTMDEKNLIETYIKKSYKYWDCIHQKDEIFLKENCFILFEGLPTDYIKIFSDILKTENLLEDDIKDNIWEIIQALTINCIKHVHCNRDFNVQSEKYTKIYFPDISLKNEFIKWNIKKT